MNWFAKLISWFRKPVSTCYQDARRHYNTSNAEWKRVVIYEPGYPKSHAIFVWFEDGVIWGRDYDYDPRVLIGVNPYSTPLELAQRWDDRAYKAWFDEQPSTVFT